MNVARGEVMEEGERNKPLSLKSVKSKPLEEGGGVGGNENC